MPLSADVLTQIHVADLLVGIGLATVEQIKGFFASRGHDPETLANIMTEVDARIARRS